MEITRKEKQSLLYNIHNRNNSQTAHINKTQIHAVYIHLNYKSIFHSDFQLQLQKQSNLQSQNCNPYAASIVHFLTVVRRRFTDLHFCQLEKDESSGEQSATKGREATEGRKHL